MWYQGEENAPDSVKYTLENIKQYAQKNNFRYVCLNKDTIENYIEISPIIKQKLENNEIHITYFSDVLRFSLLEKYGGIWMDSTLFINHNFSIENFKKDFFTFKHGKQTDKHANHSVAKFRWTSFCISATKGNPAISFVKDFLVQYATNEKHIVDYFVLDYVLNLCYQTLKEFHQTIDDLPILVAYQDMFFFDFHRNEPYTEQGWEQVKKRTPIIKTTYKIPLWEIKKETYLGYFYNRKLKW